MFDEAAFLLAIQAEPSDATAKLVYADWLDERDECERAQYVRSIAALSPVMWPLFANQLCESRHKAWLAMLRGRISVWDPVTLLALGQLQGWFEAFARCSQHSSNIMYSFSAHLQSRSAPFRHMVDGWFGERFLPVQLEQFNDWQAELRRVLRDDLLIELGKVTGGRRIRVGPIPNSHLKPTPGASGFWKQPRTAFWP